MNKKTRLVLFFTSLLFAILFINMVLDGYSSRSVSARSGEIHLKDDAINYWLSMTIYLLAGISGLYGMLQAVLNHPLFGGNAIEDASPEFQAKVIRKRESSYIDEAETFYKYGDKLAARLAVQQGLGAYPESARLKELEAIIKHGRVKN